MNTQGNKRVDYTYNAISQVTNKKRYSDTQGTNLVAETNHTYDAVNRLTNITHKKGATTIASYTQAYDAGSKITDITSSADGSSTFNYDDTDQLTGADYNYQTDENYTYDANGNRTNTGYVTGINNQLLEDSKYRYEYDKVGNRTKRTDKSTNEVTEYSWDIRDRLTGIRVINALGDVIRTANYVYDVYDQRIAKIVDSDGDGSGAATTERFVYGSNQNIALVFDGNGTLTHRYMFSNGVDQIEADEKISTGTTLWALSDHLGSVRDVVDNSGITQNHIVYDAFGNITSQSNSSVIFRNSYTGQEFDSESGLFSYGGRYYDPYNGRFIQEDKIGFNGGDANLSRYVFNSPVIFTDPDGYIAALAIGGTVVTGLVIGGILILRDLLKNQQQQNFAPQIPGLNPFIDRPTEPPRQFLPPNSPPKIPNNTETYPLRPQKKSTPLTFPADDTAIRDILKALETISRACGLDLPPFLMSNSGDVPPLQIGDKQIGKKLGKHVSDFGGNPSNSADRDRVRKTIEEIGTNPDQVVSGTFSGQGVDGARGSVDFRIKGNDVVVTKPDGTFVTILKNGVSNTSVKDALGKTK